MLVNFRLAQPGSGRDDWNTRLELDKKNRKYTLIFLDPDSCEHIDTQEYKFNGTELWSRTIEVKHDYIDHTEYDIKCGVVMEKEIRERRKDTIFGSPEEVEENILRLRTEINWENITNSVYRYFILFRHDDVLDDEEAKRFFQSEYQRISSGFRKLEERVQNIGGSIVKSKFTKGNAIHCESKIIPEESLIEIREIENGNGLAQYGISYGEFHDYEKFIQELELYITRL